MLFTCSVCSQNSSSMGVQTFYGKIPHTLLRTDSREECGKIIISSMPKRLNYCAIFIAYTLFINVVGSHIIQLGGARVGDPCYTVQNDWL